MKKNKTMRLASGLLCATLLTTSIVGGTFAKYITTDSAKDTARVAKFGVVASASGNLFGDSYVKSGQTNANEIQTAAWSANTESATAWSDDALIVAPGTQNTKGMTFTVKGTPEVSTAMHLDVPEGETSGEGSNDNKDYVNTDIYLKTGKYALMLPVTVNTTAITNDNYSQFYTYDATNHTFTQLTDTTYSSATGTVYKIVQMTGNTASDHPAFEDTTATMSADYYPISWTVTGTHNTTASSINGANAMSDSATSGSLAKAISDDLTDGSTSGARLPNQAWNNTSTVTWTWSYGTAWADASTDTVLQNWENTTLADIEDTLLGDMITLALDDNNTDYKVAVYDSATWKEVQYTTIAAASSAANEVVLAYHSSAPTASATTWKSANVACLTVSFGERITVEQVD